MFNRALNPFGSDFGNRRSSLAATIVLPPIAWTRGRRYGGGSDCVLPDERDIASVLGSVKHKPLARRPSALPDQTYARWLGVGQVGTAGSVAFRSNSRIAHAAICKGGVAVAACCSR